MKSELSLPAIPITLWSQLLLFNCSPIFNFKKFKDGRQYVNQFNWLWCIFVEQLSIEPRQQRNNSPNILNSTELSGTHKREMPTVSSVTSTEPDIVTLDDYFNDPTSPYGFGAQQPIVLPSLNDVNRPLNPFNILAAMTEVQQNLTLRDENYSPQSHEPSEPISTSPMNLSTIDGWETQQTTTDDNTSLRRTSQDEYTGPLPWMKPSIRRAHADEFTCRPVHPRRHYLAR